MLFVHRDNRLSRDSIERQYHQAIRQAQRELIIANAYFLPGYRLLWRLRRAAKRGVKVTLIVQGRPDIGMIKWATCQLYGYLLSGGVEIFEYYECQLHAKVAIMDDEWSTIGSSNLDPTSLSLNLEANVVVMDRGLNSELRENLYAMIEKPECRRVHADSLAQSRWWSGPTSVAIFHFLRHFPAWAGELPAQSIELKKVEDSGQATPTDDTTHTTQGVAANQES
jgi:cardiolipin synthase